MVRLLAKLLREQTQRRLNASGFTKGEQDAIDFLHATGWVCAEASDGQATARNSIVNATWKFNDRFELARWAVETVALMRESKWLPGKKPSGCSGGVASVQE